MKRRFFRHIAPVGAALFLAAFLTGMGGTPDTEIPEPALNFKATVTDKTDVSTACEKVSFEGETYVKGERGSSVIAVPFEKIRKITRIGETGKTKTNFQILLRSGETIAVTLNNDSRLYGVTSFGTYRILAQDVKGVTFE